MGYTMDGNFLETLFLPWWKGLVYIFALTLSVVAIRVTIRFDLNAWLKRRDSAKRFAAIMKHAKTCRHAWTLYPSSPFSPCAKCQAWISTSILVVARQFGEVKPIILAERPRVVANPQKGEVFTDSYIGAEG